MSAPLGLALAALSALTSNVGFLLRHRGAVAAPDVDVRRPLRSAVGLFRKKWWTIGYALAAVAYLFHVGALALVALSPVQAVLAAGVVIMAVVAERYFGFDLGRRQWLGIGLATAGLVGLALTAEVRSGQASADYSLPAMMAFEAALVGAGACLVLCCGRERWQESHGTMLALTAGLLFTLTHVAVKAASGKLDSGIGALLLSPLPYVALAGGVAAFFASARSLQIGPAVPVIAVTAIAGNTSSMAAGIVVFGDPLGSDAVAVVFRILAFLLVAGAAALIPGPTRVHERSRSKAPAASMAAASS